MTEAAVYIIDDDTAVRDSLELLVRSAGLRARTFPDARAFLAELDAELAGCVITDIRMPGMSGLELQDRLLARGVELPLIFLTGHGDVQGAVKALKSGAVDFVEKPFDPGRLLEQVHAAMADDAARREEQARQGAIAARLQSLTPREREVLERVAAGHANKVIAVDLGISERTVELHRSHMMKKMGAGSVAELARMVQALESGADPASRAGLTDVKKPAP